MLSVFIDTSSLRAVSGPERRILKRLGELAISGVVTVYLSDIVVREFISGTVEDTHKLIKEIAFAKKAATWVADKGQRDAIMSAIEALPATTDEWKTLVDSGFDRWIEKIGAVVLPLGTKQSEEAWSRYFAGSPPFRTPKCRTDIPDGFIFAALQELATQGGASVHVVCRDERLRKACAEELSVPVYKTLSDFVASDHVVSSEEFLDATWSSLAAEAIKNDAGVIEEQVKADLDGVLSYFEVETPWLGNEDGRATLLSAGVINNIRIDPGGPRQVNDATALFGVEVEIEDADLEVFFSHNTYSTLPGESAKLYSITDPGWNRHVMRTEIQVPATVTLTVSCEFLNAEGIGLIPGTAEIEEIDEVTLHNTHE